MNARIFAAATLVAACSWSLPAKAADAQMLNLVMPDAKVVAGVNVDQARATPFGQYVLGQIAPQDAEFQKLTSLIGFDPRLDVRELLVASGGPAEHSGLALARGRFDPAKVAALAAEKGAKSESYKGITLLEDPKQEAAVAFLDATLVAAGDVASVKAAIDRLGAPAILPAALITQINDWSYSQDAWLICAAPPASLKPPATAPQVPGMTGQVSFQAIQQAAAGVKFGSMVVLTAKAMTDTPQNATSLVGVMQLLNNLAQMQAAQNPQAAALLKSMVVSAQGTTVNLTMSLPEDQIQQLTQPRRNVVVRKRAGARQM